ncbi:P-loop containing nucleoside triphosphate hydrolase [Elaphomyces granulatus]
MLGWSRPEDIHRSIPKLRGQATRAFALKTKQWWADNISEIVPSEESIDILVLGEDELKTIRGLAKRQGSKHQSSQAEAWNALVDEADIFLERRENRGLARNGLILPRMEYFRGLLFLTTNRVGRIDDAFVSRVHVIIGYEAPSGEDRQKIWNGSFRKLERASKIQVAPGAKKWVLEMAVKGTAQLNGRDIHNTLQTANTLAETECEEDPDFDPSTMTIVVDQSHFQRVLD